MKLIIVCDNDPTGTVRVGKELAFKYLDVPAEDSAWVSSDLDLDLDESEKENMERVALGQTSYITLKYDRGPVTVRGKLIYERT